MCEELNRDVRDDAWHPTRRYTSCLRLCPSSIRLKSSLVPVTTATEWMLPQRDESAGFQNAKRRKTKYDDVNPAMASSRPVAMVRAISTASSNKVSSADFACSIGTSGGASSKWN
jgi:hypothetical protein